MSRAQRGQGGNWERISRVQGDEGSIQGVLGVRVDVSGTSWGQRNGEV